MVYFYHHHIFLKKELTLKANTPVINEDKIVKIGTTVDSIKIKTSTKYTININNS